MQTQHGDYQDRLDRPFLHTAYCDERTAFRDQLKLALAGTPAEGEPTAADLAEKIKKLKESHKVEAVPMRIREQKPRLELVRRRAEPELQEAPAVLATPPAPVAEFRPIQEPEKQPEAIPFRHRIGKGGQVMVF